MDVVCKEAFQLLINRANKVDQHNAELTLLVSKLEKKVEASQSCNKEKVKLKQKSKNVYEEEECGCGQAHCDFYLLWPNQTNSFRSMFE